MIRKAVISLFVLLNIGTVFHVNRPDWIPRVWGLVSESPTPEWAYRRSYMDWVVRRYAHLVGLDNRWEMFSTLHRFDWWIRIYGIDRFSNRKLLTLPLQSERGFFQRQFADFREAKFHLNMYGDEQLRNQYARYLCGPSVNSGNEKYQAIEFELFHRNLRVRKEAELTGTHRQEGIFHQRMGMYQCESA